jgi:phosphoglycerate dehydrogenase-like enzyme
VNLLIPDAVFDDDHAIERVAASPDTILLRRASAAKDIAAEDWRAADAVVAYYKLAYDAAIAARLTTCRILVRAGVGTDNVDLAAFGARGIPVCNVPDYGTGEVADHTIALILALTRGIVEFHRGIAADPVGGWDWRRWPAPVRRLKGQKLLLVGYGAIGRAVARRAASLDLSVGFYDPYAPPGLVTLYDTLEAGLAEADIVSLHAMLTPETHGLIDACRIAGMKRGAILINTARGALVDLDALNEGLASGLIGAAALDVLENEPPDPAHPLFRALKGDASWLRGRLILTPHAAFLSADSIVDMRRKAVETAMTYLRTGQLVHCVNGAQLIPR